MEGQKDSISHTLQKSLDTNQSLAEYLSNTKKLQYRLVDKAMKAQVDKMLECSLSSDAARLRSLQGKGAGAWLNSIPSSKTLSPGNFILAASLRLGLAVPLPHWAYNCECGKKLDPEGYHFLTCKVGGGPVWSHNYMVSAWSDCRSQLYLPHNIVPKDRYTTSQGRPDIYVADSFSGLSVELDIALSHPLCKDVLSRAAWLDGVAASRRDELKHKKYAAQELPGGFLPSAIPLVFEHYGRWGGRSSEISKEPLSVVT